MKPTAQSVEEKICNTFPIQNDLKEGEDLQPLLFNFVLAYAIRRDQESQGGLKPTSFWPMLMT
jgi:hypothetical protein